MKIITLLFLLLLPFLTVQSQESLQDEISKEFLLGKINYQQENNFVIIDRQHASRPMYLHREVYDAFIEMFNAARNQGITLQIISAARNFDHQRSIWERKWKNYQELDPLGRTEKILEYSSMPSTSRHHWGTDIDLNNLENSYFETGQGKQEYEWLTANASQFGFYQVYTSKAEGRKGYAEEKWHWSYLPLANHFLRAYNQRITYQDIQGFKGSELAETKEMIPAYVNGIGYHYREELSSEQPEVEIASAGTKQ